MGWASGSYIAEDLWQKVKKYVAKPDHQKVAEAIVSAFEENDADDWSMDKGSVYAVARPKEAEEYHKEMESYEDDA